MFSFLLGKQEWNRVGVCFNLIRNWYFSKVFLPFSTPTSSVYKNFNFTSLPVFSVMVLSYFSHFSGCEVVSAFFISNHSYFLVNPFPPRTALAVFHKFDRCHFLFRFIYFIIYFLCNTRVILFMHSQFIALHFKYIVWMTSASEM